MYQYFSYVAPVAALPNFERLASATDPLGLVTRNSYDTATDLTLLFDPEHNLEERIIAEQFVP